MQVVQYHLNKLVIINLLILNNKKVKISYNFNFFIDISKVDMVLSSMLN